jgi:hypothetical protein
MVFGLGELKNNSRAYRKNIHRSTCQFCFMKLGEYMDCILFSRPVFEGFLEEENLRGDYMLTVL